MKNGQRPAKLFQSLNHVSTLKTPMGLLLVGMWVLLLGKTCFMLTCISLPDFLVNYPKGWVFTPFSDIPINLSIAIIERGCLWVAPFDLGKGMKVFRNACFDI